MKNVTQKKIIWKHLVKVSTAWLEFCDEYSLSIDTYVTRYRSVCCQVYSNSAEDIFCVCWIRSTVTVFTVPFIDSQEKPIYFTPYLSLCFSETELIMNPLPKEL
jgi:hypothetical protein